MWAFHVNTWNIWVCTVFFLCIKTTERCNSFEVAHCRTRYRKVEAYFSQDRASSIQPKMKWKMGQMNIKPYWKHTNRCRQATKKKWEPVYEHCVLQTHMLWIHVPSILWITENAKAGGAGGGRSGRRTTEMQIYRQCISLTRVVCCSLCKSFSINRLWESEEWPI